MANGGDPKTAAEWAEASRRFIEEADSVLKIGHRLIAYERYGYAAEAAAKALILRCGVFAQWPLPGDPEAEHVYSHSLSKLMKVAGVFQTFCTDRAARPRLKHNWLVAKEWVPNRYSVNPPEHNLVVKLRHAMKEPVDGIIPWLDAQ